MGLTLSEKYLKACEFDTSKFEEASSVKDMNSGDREYFEFLRGEWNESAKRKPLDQAVADLIRACEAWSNGGRHEHWQEADLHKALAELEKAIEGEG